MSEQVALQGTRPRPHVSEERIARWMAISLPIVTLLAAAVVAILIGPATSILVLAAGLLLGVIAILWGSLRVLTGEAPLSPEFEVLEMAVQGTSALSNRKTMLLRSLKDLENERSIGKLEDADYDELASTYRSELKEVLKQIDQILAPHRSKAEEVARAYLADVGVARTEGIPFSELPTSISTNKPNERVTCSDCGESNEHDAKFCKGCAARLSFSSKTTQESGRGGDDDA